MTPVVARIEQRAQAAQSCADDGAKLLVETRDFIKRFVSFPSDHCLNATTLWAAHAHLTEQFYTTPRLALLSPEPESGKTRVLEVLNTLVPDPMFSLSPSPATIFRTLYNGNITLVIDEVDTIFTKKGKDDNNEDLRGLLNAGYKRGAKIPRCVGNKHDVEMFPVYCATALAGLGDLPDTIMSRSVIIRMRRRAGNEKVEPFYIRDHEPQGNVLRDRLLAWSSSVADRIRDARPVMPDGVVDRAAEVWEPLLAVADAAGGDWPKISRDACKELSKPSDRRVSLGVRLLGDLKTIFGNDNAMHTKRIIEKLCDPEKNGLEADAPWSELNGGKPLTERNLASLLKRYGVSPTKVTIHNVNLQGYQRAPLYSQWTRYLPPSTPAKAESAELAELPGRRDQPASSGSVPLAGDPELLRNSEFSHDARGSSGSSGNSASAGVENGEEVV